MSTEHDDTHATSVDRIAAELAALGEPELSDDEVDASLDAHADVRTVGTLVSLGEPLPEPLVRPLSELELARVYRKVAMRMPAAARHVGDPSPAGAHHEPAPGSRRSMLTALTVIAAAAAFILVPNLRRGANSLDTPQRRAAALAGTAQAGEAARVGLDALGSSGSARASALAEDYARRMNARPEGGTQ